MLWDCLPWGGRSTPAIGRAPQMLLASHRLMPHRLLYPRTLRRFSTTERPFRLLGLGPAVPSRTPLLPRNIQSTYGLRVFHQHCPCDLLPWITHWSERRISLHRHPHGRTWRRSHPRVGVSTSEE